MVKFSKKYQVYYKVKQARAHYSLAYLICIGIIIAAGWNYYLFKNMVHLIWGAGIPIVIIVLIESIAIRESILYLASNGITRERGILGKEFITINYEDIVRTRISQNIIQRILNEGNLDIDTSGMEESEMDFKNIPTPEKYKKIVDELSDKAKTLVTKQT